MVGSRWSRLFGVVAYLCTWWPQQSWQRGAPQSPPLDRCCCWQTDERRWEPLEGLVGIQRRQAKTHVVHHITSSSFHTQHTVMTLFSLPGVFHKLFVSCRSCKAWVIGAVYSLATRQQSCICQLNHREEVLMRQTVQQNKHVHTSSNYKMM